ncbi:hypothetical protein [Aeromonas hydrophila]|uniref:hypothetical protein n=1 Tax=Aeromonas hydrophila TaxID=644 RepID=UPI002B48830A|nr:hypothetical protein [Aeromonas hydrophila]
MAKLPDANDLGRRGPQIAGGVASADMTQVSRAMQGLGNAIANTAGAIGEKIDRLNYADAQSHYLKKKIKIISAFENDNDYATFNDRFNEEIAKARDEASSMLRNNEDLRTFSIEADNDIARSAEQIRNLARGKEKDHEIARVGNDIEERRNVALSTNDEATRQALIQANSDAIWGLHDRGFLTEQDAMKMSRGAAEDYALASVLMLDPAGRVAALSKPGIVDLIPADKRAQIKMQAEDHLEVVRLRNQQRAEMAASRAEANAGRVIGQINAQIVSGIPATEEMWRDWGRQVAGTPLQSEFNELAKQEVNIQKVMRLPYDQQVAFVNQKTAELQTSGGSVTEANNLARLRRAIDANGKMLTNEPLNYFQQRLGGNVQPLDMNSPDLPAVLNDRVAALHGMQSRFGPTVGMKPLLPEEAKQLSASLEKMTPEEQSQLFGTLHSAMGDDQAYVGAMQQIAPNSPVRALSGILAGKQRSMTVDTYPLRRWKPDDVVTSGDVAKTLALGEQILNKSKSEKSQDGTSRFPIPKQEEFKLALDQYLGSAFAGQPKSYELAAQAVKSYYTGAAAQSGDISGQIDNSLMKKAIRATVGDVVDFNGTKTIAPWGMPGDAFEELAKQKIESALSFDPQAKGISGALTLRQARDGIYYVMQGQQFKYGPDGKPMMINFNEDQ